MKMRILGTRGIPYGNLRFPGKWRSTYIGNPQAKEYAALLASGDAKCSMPIVRVRDKKLIYGLWLIAAARQMGKDHVMVKVADATEEETKFLLEHDIAFPSNQAAHFDAIRDCIANAEIVENGEEVIAAAEANVRARVLRSDAKTKARKRSERRAAAGVDEQGIRSPWAELDDDFKRQTNHLVLQMSEAARFAKQAFDRMSTAQSMALPLHEARFNKAKEQLSITMKLIRGLVPACICPYCKGVEALQEKCGFCMMTGYITESQEEGVPKELWRTENPVVFQAGQVKPLSDFILEDRKPEVDDAFGLEDA